MCLEVPSNVEKSTSSIGQHQALLTPLLDCGTQVYWKVCCTCGSPVQ